MATYDSVSRILFTSNRSWRRRLNIKSIGRPARRSSSQASSSPTLDYKWNPVIYPCTPLGKRALNALRSSIPASLLYFFSFLRFPPCTFLQNPKEGLHIHVQRVYTSSKSITLHLSNITWRRFQTLSEENSLSVLALHRQCQSSATRLGYVLTFGNIVLRETSPTVCFIEDNSSQRSNSLFSTKRQRGKDAKTVIVPTSFWCFCHYMLHIVVC